MAGPVQVLSTTACVAANDQSLRAAVVTNLTPDATLLVHEMSLPSERLRADIASIKPRSLVGYELKSCADRLDRLSRQIPAYEEVFDYCHVVVGRVHLEPVREIVPPWWGIQTVTKDGQRLFTVRRSRPHNNVRADVFVRLLWRD